MTRKIAFATIRKKVLSKGGRVTMRVGIVMGSQSDYHVVERAEKILDEFQVKTEIRIISAHRTPYVAEQFAREAEEKGIDVIIAAAGKRPI